MVKSPNTCIVIKNVILYDPYQHVVGFVELKNMGDTTYIKVRHNLADTKIELAINDYTYNLVAREFITELSPPIDLDRQILVSITHTKGNTTTTLASGDINIDRQPFSKALSRLPPLQAMLQDTKDTPIDRSGAPPPPIIDTLEQINSSAIKEIDEILRLVCTIDDEGKGICEICPYREFFYGENIEMK